MTTRVGSGDASSPKGERDAFVTARIGSGDPPDAAGFQYYIVPEDGDENPLTRPSNTVFFAPG